MPLIFRYIIKEYLKIFLLTVAALTLVYLMIDVIEKMMKFTMQPIQFIWMVEYFLYKLPRIIFDITPLAILLSTLLTLGTLSKNNELIAFKSLGVGIFKIATPLLILGAIVSLSLFYLNGSLIPSSYKKARTTQQIKIEGKREKGTFIQNKIWLRLDSRTLFKIELLDPIEARMNGIDIYYLGDDFSFQEEIEAQTLTYENGEWILWMGIRRRFLPDGTVQIEPFNRKRIQLNKTPRDFQEVVAKPDEMTYQQLQSYITRLSADGFNANRYQVDLRGKQAFPFVNFIMVLLGIPFALQDSRSTGIARGVAISLSMGLFYWLVFSMTISLGHVMILPPWLAGWGANILFMTIGSYFFLNIRQ